MHDIPKLLNLLQDVLGSYQKFAKGEYYFQCPFCNKKKMAVNVISGKWHCWVCSSAGRKILSLFSKIDILPEQKTALREILSDDDISNFSYYDQDTQVVLRLPAEFTSLTQPSNTYSYKHAMRYLTNRNIGAPDIHRYNIGVCYEGEYANRIIIPSYDDNRKLNYFIGRDFYNTSTLKYKNPKVSKNVVCFENLINYNYPLVLCEGMFDAIAIRNNAIPLLGKTLPSALLARIREKNVEAVYIVLDRDAQDAATRMAEKLSKSGVVVYQVVPDKKDPGDIGFLGMHQKLVQSTAMTYSDLLKNKLTF